MFFHLSEAAGIEQLVPRIAQPGEEALVWAIDAEHLRNYLVPRDCPRVTFTAGPATTEADRARFMPSGAPVVAIESAWYTRLAQCRLYRYHLPPGPFTCLDAGAGYHVSRETVVPVHVDVIEHPLDLLLQQRVEVRLVPSLWALHDAVAASTLQFSMIRMRNAAPRDTTPRNPATSLR